MPREDEGNVTHRSPSLSPKPIPASQSHQLTRLDTSHSRVPCFLVDIVSLISAPISIVSIIIPISLSKPTRPTRPTVTIQHPFNTHPTSSCPSSSSPSLRSLSEAIPHTTQNAGLAGLLVGPAGLAVCHGLVLAVALVGLEAGEFVGSG
jgi:hypothetical protein